jgi:hypothetical protein
MISIFLQNFSHGTWLKGSVNDRSHGQKEVKKHGIAWSDTAAVAFFTAT